MDGISKGPFLSRVTNTGIPTSKNSVNAVVDGNEPENDYYMIVDIYKERRKPVDQWL
jgi:hypothetical protein